MVVSAIASTPQSYIIGADTTVRKRTILYIHARECTEVSQTVIGRSEHIVQPLRSVS